MQARRVGRSGLLVSEIGLGTNNFGTRVPPSRARRILARARDLGITFVDTADTYGYGSSETIIGSAIHPGRHELVLATKFGAAVDDSPYHRGGSRAWIRQAVEASLRRLRTDYIDLYQLHVPDPDTPIVETLRALEELVQSGKVRYVGISNFAAWQITDAYWTARTEGLARPVSVQFRHNLLFPADDDERLAAVRAAGMGLIPFQPLAAGFLTGKYRPQVTPKQSRLAIDPIGKDMLVQRNYERLSKLEALAAGAGLSLTALACSWLLSQEIVASVIASVSTVRQLDENVASRGVRLDAATMNEVESIAVDS